MKQVRFTVHDSYDCGNTRLDWSIYTLIYCCYLALDKVEIIAESYWSTTTTTTMPKEQVKRERHVREPGYTDTEWDRPHRRRSGRHSSVTEERDLGEATKAAVIAGVTEAIRSRNEPGSWTGPKGQRVATAALGAFFVNQMFEDPEESHVIKSVIGGLLTNRVANGPRGRSRRSRSGSDVEYERVDSCRSRATLKRFMDV